MKKIMTILLFLLTSISYAATPKPLTVVLDWSINPDHAPLVIAEQQGFFKEQGVEVKFITPSDPADPSKWVAAGKADIGISYEPWFIEHVDQGLPLIRIGTLIDKPLNCIVALKRSGIKSLNDLKGKDIGETSNSLTNSMLMALLAKQGMSKSDVNVTNIRQNLTQSLLSNKIHAVSGMMRNVEVPALEASGHKLVVFFPEEHGIPNYSELIFVANTKNAKDPRYAHFLQAVKKAVQFIDQHPQAAWETFAKAYPEANNAVNKQSWFATMPYFAEDPANFDDEEWKNFAAFMQKNKLIDKVQPVSRYATILR